MGKQKRQGTIQVAVSLAIAAFAMSGGCVSANPPSDSLTKARLAANAQPAFHLLDGTSLDYFYDDGSGVHMEIIRGQLKYEWIAGLRKGNGNQHLPYTSRKIRDGMYLVSWLEASHPDYTSLIFDFTNRRMFSTGIFRFGSANQFTRFDQGKIENLSLVESENDHRKGKTSWDKRTKTKQSPCSKAFNPAPRNR